MSWIILLTGFVSGFIVAVVVVKRVTISFPPKRKTGWPDFGTESQIEPSEAPKKITVPEEDKWCGNCKYDNAMACINCGCGGSPVCSGWVSYLSTEVPEEE